MAWRASRSPGSDSARLRKMYHRSANAASFADLPHHSSLSARPRMWHRIRRRYPARKAHARRAHRYGRVAGCAAASLAGASLAQNALAASRFSSRTRITESSRSLAILLLHATRIASPLRLACANSSPTMAAVNTGG